MGYSEQGMALIWEIRGSPIKGVSSDTAAALQLERRCQLGSDWCDPSSLELYGETHDHNVHNWLSRRKKWLLGPVETDVKSRERCPVQVGWLVQKVTHPIKQRRRRRWLRSGRSDSLVANVSNLSNRNSPLNIKAPCQ